jgi:hypothetical protein
LDTQLVVRNDKQGLLLTHRRKRHWNAQETIILLNDLAHNWVPPLSVVDNETAPI